MRNFAVVFSTLLPFSLLALSPQLAFAQDDDAPPAPPPAAAPPPGAVLVPVQEAPQPKTFAIIANPLALSIDRYSVQGEWSPALHHAITLNPFYTSASAGSATINGQTTDFGTLHGFGAELGYKYYTGQKGFNGFFVGPSILFGSYSQSGGVNFDGTSNSGGSFTSIGGAIDIGGQGQIGGFVIGGGFGLQWTKTSTSFDTDNFNLASAIIAGGGTRPRFLFTIGYAF
ncbi:MAG TPA: hypothetical protein VGM44_19930 [Polyangiaceae bacterium]|jgi:hypothetical protein